MTMLQVACLHNQGAMVGWCQQQGATDWNGGLQGACEGGHVELAGICLRLGARLFRQPLFNALAHPESAVRAGLVRVLFDAGCPWTDDVDPALCSDLFDAGVSPLPWITRRDRRLVAVFDSRRRVLQHTLTTTAQLYSVLPGPLWLLVASYVDWILLVHKQTR